jgi:hypothetical protein
MWNKKGRTEKQKAIDKLDHALSVLVRTTFPKECATCLEIHDEYDCGHWQKREHMATRFHPMNIFPQGLKENRFEGGQEWQFAKGIVKRYGKGADDFLYGLAHPKHEKGKIAKDDGWQVNELDCLRDATKRGWNVYWQLYFSLRPGHKLK